MSLSLVYRLVLRLQKAISDTADDADYQSVFSALNHSEFSPGIGFVRAESRLWLERSQNHRWYC